MSFNSIIKTCLKIIICLAFLFSLSYASFKAGEKPYIKQFVFNIDKYIEKVPDFLKFTKLLKYNLQEGDDFNNQMINLDNVSKFLKNYNEFQKLGGKITETFPILTDYYDHAGIAKGCYFHQDLLVASFIHEMNPLRHIDIGSRIDGFVAHVASFRPIELIDIRDIKDSIYNVSFLKLDISNDNMIESNITDSISSLHVIEHLGLGRYGDDIDPNGHIKGFNNILKMLKPGGTLYISFPISTSTKTLFNAHRTFHPLDILNWANEPNSVELVRFDYVDSKGDLQSNNNIFDLVNDKNFIAQCGIYTLKKIK